MKRLMAIVLLMTLSGCANGRFFPGGYGAELAHQCKIDPYSADCLQPPAVFTN